MPLLKGGLIFRFLLVFVGVCWPNLKGDIVVNKNMNLQDVFLNQVRREKIAVTIFLTNGFQFKGMVKGFDSYVVILDSDGKQNLVYKHAISTIIPAKAISILDFNESDGEGTMENS